jgi:hypothetical protein
VTNPVCVESEPWRAQTTHELGSVNALVTVAIKALAATRALLAAGLSGASALGIAGGRPALTNTGAATALAVFAARSAARSALDSGHALTSTKPFAT